LWGAAAAHIGAWVGVLLAAARALREFLTAEVRQCSARLGVAVHRRRSRRDSVRVCLIGEDAEVACVIAVREDAFLCSAVPSTCEIAECVCLRCLRWERGGNGRERGMNTLEISAGRQDDHRARPLTKPNEVEDPGSWTETSMYPEEKQNLFQLWSMPDLYCIPLDASLARVMTRLPLFVVTWPVLGDQGQSKRERGTELTGFVPL
jgi:hypothetical protein